MRRTILLVASRMALFLAHCLQISHHTALPWEEIRQNPYTVMLTTVTGGHLSWFEVGGTRWFAKPVGFQASTLKALANDSKAANFLMKMAEGRAEVIKPSLPVAREYSDRLSLVDRPFQYSVMRRKLRMPMGT